MFSPNPRQTGGDMYNRIHALLLDDNTFARGVGRRILTSAGVGAISEASSGQDALALLKGGDRPVDIVFCDLIMPDMDGIQFVRHVASLPTRPAFALVSAADYPLLNTFAATAKARDLNVVSVIQKPLTLSAACRALDLFIDRAMPTRVNDRALPDFTSEDVQAALDNGQLMLHFQPKVALADGRLDGVEALARWQHPEYGLVPPGAFVHVAEKSGLIGAMTDRTIQLALRQCAAWTSLGLHLKVSVNLSSRMLVDVDFPDRLARQVAQAGIDPKQFILEVTETGLFQNLADGLEILTRLRMKGFPLSIDDFGTGYSSMEQLSQIPFSEIKVDRAFVRDAANRPHMRVILESSVDLGRKLGLSVVAEGAEFQWDWDLLHQLRVDLVQGFFIAKPMPPEEIQTWSRARTPVPSV